MKISAPPCKAAANELRLHGRRNREQRYHIVARITWTASAGPWYDNEMSYVQPAGERTFHYFAKLISK